METLAQLPDPRLWTCERCSTALSVWDWGVHDPFTTDLPSAVCSDCLVELAPPEQQGFVTFKQTFHHTMRLSVGEPPGTLVAWTVDLMDRSGEPIAYPSCIYTVCVDRWDESWPQTVFPWRPDSWNPLAVVLGAHVTASPRIAGSWVFLWSWARPEQRESCLLDPPDCSLTDGEAARLNAARGAFYTWNSRRGKRKGNTTWSQKQFYERVSSERAAFEARHGRMPFDTELAALIGVSESTFKRYKRDWGVPSS